MKNINLCVQDLEKLWQIGWATGWEATFYFWNDTTLLKIYNEKISEEMRYAKK